MAGVVLTSKGGCCCAGAQPAPCFGSLCGCNIVGPFVARLLSFVWAGSPVTVPPGVGCVDMPCGGFAGSNSTGMDLSDGSRLLDVNFGFACIGLNFGAGCSGTVLAFYGWATVQLPDTSLVTVEPGGVGGPPPVPAANTILNATRTPGGGFDGPCSGFCLLAAPWCGGAVCDVDSFLGAYDTGEMAVTLARGTCSGRETAGGEVVVGGP